MKQKQIPQTMPAESEMDGNTFPPNRLKEAKAALDSQAYVTTPAHRE